MNLNSLIHQLSVIRDSLPDAGEMPIAVREFPHARSYEIFDISHNNEEILINIEVDRFYS
jgi:hypothetical protein